MLLQAFAGSYVLLSLYFFVHAIEALRPRSRVICRTTDANTAHALPVLLVPARLIIARLPL